MILEKNNGVPFTFELFVFILYPNIKLLGIQIDSIPLFIS